MRTALFRVPRFYEYLSSQQRYALTQRLGIPYERDYREVLILLDAVQRPLILDVGANQGQSVLAFKRLMPRATVISFEPNPVHTESLTRLTERFDDYSFHRVGLSESECTAHLFVPTYSGKTMTGLASFDEGEARSWLGPDKVFGFDPRKLHVDALELPIKTLDSFSLAPDLIKIDVQGFEQQVISGAVETLRRSKPLLLLESPSDDLIRLLYTYGYEDRATRTGLNTIFVPSRSLSCKGEPTAK